jgi:propanol-preferring alcohol dehydrogenase
MLGKHIDGGFAEHICVPARNAVHVPGGISLDQAAIMMCSSATALHAMRRGRLKEEESIAVFGCGGLGLSAIQIAHILNAGPIFAVDIREAKLERASTWGAVPINAAQIDPVQEIRRMTLGRGVDVSLELVGTVDTMEQAAASLANRGRAVVAGIATEPLVVDTYRTLIDREIELIGCSDHLLNEVKELLQWAAAGFLDLSEVIVQYLPLDAERINEVLDEMAQFSLSGRAVIVPGRQSHGPASRRENG